MAAELELNSVSPPPDTVEEEKERKESLKLKTYRRAKSRYVSSKRELSKVRHLANDRKAVYSSVTIRQSTWYTTLIVRL